MHIPRVYLDVPLAAGHDISLDDRAHHHLRNVLRLKPGARMVLFNGRGGEYLATLKDTDRRFSSVIADAFVDVDREPSLSIQLLQGIAKGARMDYVLQKAVELGVGRVQPVLTRYAAAIQANWRHKMTHWRGVVISACERSGRTRIPELSAPRHLQDCLSLHDATLALVLDPRGGHSLRDIQQPAQRVALLIGPEGGLSDEELAQARCAGFKSVRMGPRTLRAETAAIAVLAVAQSLWGDLG